MKDKEHQNLMDFNLGRSKRRFSKHEGIQQYVQSNMTERETRVGESNPVHGHCQIRIFAGG